MKEWASKAFKFIGASIGVLVAAYTIGWSGAITLHNMFKSEQADAQAYVNSKISDTKSEIISIHNADMKGINGQLKILINQNNLIITQNYRTRKLIEEEIK